MEKAETEGVRVTAESFYLDSESNPEEGIYIFAYRIKITNFRMENICVNVFCGMFCCACFWE